MLFAMKLEFDYVAFLIISVVAQLLKQSFGLFFKD